MPPLNADAILPFGGKKPLRAKIVLRAAVFSANIKTL